MLTETQYLKIGQHYHSLLFIRSSKDIGAILSPTLDFNSIEEVYLRSNPQITVVDDLLTDDALESLLNFCLESTVWFDMKPGYVGTYFQDGFGESIALIYLVNELRSRFPRIIGDLPLVNAWAYKYDSANKGILVHADDALINLNIWLTPDEANNDPTSGGLVIYNERPPTNSSFADYNSVANEASILDLVGSGETTKITYKQNRLVMFDSRLLHKSDRHMFKEGYLNRRINLTLLFGVPRVT